MAAAAAIGIAAFIFVLFAVGGVWGLKRRRRREREDRAWAERHNELPVRPAEMPGEVEGTAWYETFDHIELEQIKSPVEIGVWHPDPQELDATERKGVQKDDKKG